MAGLKLNTKITLVAIGFVVVPVVILGCVLFWHMESMAGSENIQQIRESRNVFIGGIVVLALLLAFVINFMVKRLLGRHLMEDNMRREILVKNAEIRALQNQINAHFIYNVLESIKMMAEIDEEYTISDAVTSLGKLLRYSMRWNSGNVKVREELEYIRDYLALINLRIDYKIYLSLNIPESLMGQEIPKMSLQPVVENAIYHGIEPMAEDTNIYIKGVVDGDDCVIEVTDAGKGMTEEELERVRKKIAGEIETSGGSGNGIGLKNVQDRISMSFGKDYGISIASMSGCYTKVMVRIPLNRQGVMERD